jgi:hypothetical protein
MIGDDQGSHDSTTASLLFGLSRIGLTIIHVERKQNQHRYGCLSSFLFAVHHRAGRRVQARVELNPMM